jgi:CheY-like chemotaxis protein
VNILYIEDNPLDRMLVERYVRTTSHQLKVLPKLLDIDLAALNIDLLLLDMYFGGKTSGLDYLKQIRQMGIQCPVAAVTALALPQQIDQYHSAGIDRVIKKPFEITELAELIAYFDRDVS